MSGSSSLMAKKSIWTSMHGIDCFQFDGTDAYRYLWFYLFDSIFRPQPALTLFDRLIQYESIKQYCIEYELTIKDFNQLWVWK